MQQLQQQHFEVLPYIDQQIVVPASETAVPVEGDRIPMPSQVGAAAVHGQSIEGTRRIHTLASHVLLEHGEFSPAAPIADADTPEMSAPHSGYTSPNHMQAAYRIGPIIGGRKSK
jgi:hypothetical protein